MNQLQTEPPILPPDDPETLRLAVLLEQVTELRATVLRGSRQRLERYRTCYPGEFTPSARNLAHYLTLRQQDLRELQDGLAAQGLSSLGRCEGHVLHSLDKVAGLLHLAVTCRLPESPDTGAPVSTSDTMPSMSTPSGT